MRLLLTTLNSKYIHTNLAIRLLYQLNKQREGLQWKEFTIKEDFDAIAAYCAPFEVVAFSCYIWNISQTLQVAQRIKQQNPNCLIMLGGPEVSYDWQQVITLNYVDFIVTGEGEMPFAAFLRDFPRLDNVPSLVRKINGEVHYNPSIENFDLTALTHIMPYADDAVETLLNKVLYVETSRGCPYKCEFCLASLDNKMRYLPNESLKQTLLFLMQHGRTIKFLDRTFNIKKDFTLDIFRFILEHYQPHNVFQFEITADIIHPDIIAFIQNSLPKGLFRFEIGIQTVNQTANRAVSRKQNFDKTSSIIKALEDKVEMHLDLIVGLPLDYWDDIKHSIEAVFKLYPPELQLGFLKFLKGTPVRDKSEQHDFVFDPAPPYQIIESKYLSRQQLHQITQLEHALEIYWNKKRALNTLRYVAQQYSIFDFLLGLGIYFGSQRDYHQYSLEDAFNILMQYAAATHPSDKVLQQLIATDYYLHHKTRPKPFADAELDKREQNRLVETLHLDKEHFRYVFLLINFDSQAWFSHYSLQPADNPQQLCIRYNGKQKAIINTPVKIDN